MISLLYIDDEPGLLELGKLFLESAGGFEVSTALSGDEGLGQLAQHDFDAIVSDFQMPGMDGIALLKKVRKSFGTIPFVLFTGRGREEVVIEAINNGVDFYLQKGGDPKAQFAELAHKVRQAVSRRQAETALSDSEKRLADIINFLPDATFAIDTHGVVIAWNRAMERMTGVKSEDVLGKGDYEYALPFYHERRPLLINLVLEDDPAIGEKYPFVKREGRTLFSEITIPHFNNGRGAALWFTASPLYDRKGEIVGAIESIREITERKLAEEARSESERRFRELADLLPQGIYESDTEGRMTYVNRLALEMFGFTAEDVEKGLNALDVIAPEDRKRAGTVFAKMVETGTREQGNEEYRAVRKDGRRFPVSIYSSPIFRNGRVSGVRGVIIDITDRKKAEETLLSANQEYTSLLDQIQDVYYRSDTGGRLVRASRSWATLFGYNNVSECIGRSIADDFYFKASDRNILLDEVARKGKVTGYEVTLKKKTGEPVLVEVSSHPYYDAQGNILGIEGTFRDIAERKKAEDELRAANEQLVASDEELRAQYDELALGEKRVRMSETRLRYMLGFDEYAKKSERELLEYAIEGAGVVTDSPLGYLAFLNEDESELSMYAWSKNAMAECSMRTKPIVYKTEKTGLWGEAVRQRQAVITNDYAAPDPAKKGYPEGHPRIIRHMNVPVIDDDHIVIVAGVANKPSDYTENDVNELLLLVQGLWNILKRRRAEETRNESEEKYRNIIDNAPAGMHFYELKPNGSLVFTGSNPGADRILGVVHRQFIGKTIEDAFPPLAGAEVSAQYRRIARDGGVWQTDRVTYDGEAIHGAYAVTAFQISPGAMVASFMDITERKKMEADLKAAYEQVTAAEEELREQYDTLAAAQAEISSRRQQLEEIAATVPGVVYQFYARPDGSRGMYFASARTNEIFGLESDLGRFFPEFTDCVHPDDRPGFISSIEDAVKRRTDWHYEGRFIRHSGEIIWFEGISSPVVHGNELVFTGVILDITERKRMEEAIRESEGRYRSLVELSPDAVVVHLGGKVLYANPAALRLTGAEKEEEIIGREVISFVHPDDRAMALEDFRQMYEEGKIIPLKEERLLRINGDPYTVEVIASPIQYQGRQSVLAVFRDITERKRAEAALRESEEKYRSLVENIPFGITLIDADHRIVISNAAQGQMFHTDTGLWTGRYCYREFEKRDAVCTHCPGTRAMATGVCHEVETEGVRDDGTRFNARIHAIPLLDNEGRGTRFIEVVEDITERKTAEDALRQNEAKYRALVETTGTGFVILDHEGRVLDANPEYIRMTGHTRLEDISGRNVTEWTAAHEQDRNADAVRQCIRDGFIRNFEIDYTDNSGAITPVEINAKVVQSEGAVHILTLCRDISGRKRVEDELLRLKISTDHSSDEVFWMDFAGNILYVNDAACQVTGYSREEFLKMKIFELDPDVRPNTWDASVTDLRERKTQFITTRHRRKDGVIIDVEIVAVYVNQYDQEYSFAYVRDITDRKRADDTLRETSRKYAELFELGGEAIFLIDNETGALLEANAAACEMYGYQRDLLLTMKNTDLSAEKEETKKVTTETPPGVVRVPIRYHRRKDGTVFPVEIMGRFFVWDGRPVHIAAIRDITEKNRTEAAIREANRKLNLLNSITRHDIRNQLTVAQGYTQLAALSKPDPVITDFLARITAAIETIQRQIEFTKTYQELGVHAPAWFRIVDVVRRVRPGKTALHTTCNTVEIFADPMIDMVFFNLFDNAMKYGETVTAVTVGCERRGNTLVIIFADNGCGIEPGEKQKIFEKGYGKNTGLGLFLVREILAITDITISETGTPGKGAVFEIVVPQGAYRNAE